MEDRELVVKALLECYPYIDDMCDTLTRMTEKCVADGYYAVFMDEQMRLYEKIMKYNARRSGLYRIKNILEAGTGGRMPLLRARFMDGKSAAVVASEGEIPLRTVYRRLQTGISALAAVLEKMGYDKKHILKEFGDEPLFSAMLKRVIDEDDEVARVNQAVKRTNIAPFGEITLRSNRRSRPRRDKDDRAFA